MLTAALVSLGVVFVAELGDKSQLMTMTYALRHRWWVVLSGIAIASFLVHGMSVTIGHFLGLTLPERPIAFAAAIAFLLFAVWTWRERGDDGEGLPVAEPRHVLFAVISSFVLAELGDKTMLATVALASDYHWAGVWIGATAGMVLADGVAIAVGAVLHKRLPAGFLHGMASVLFALFGLWLLFDGALGWRGIALAVTGSVALLAGVVATAKLVRRRREHSLALPALEPSPESAGSERGYRPRSG
ncbi:TMEM165/GDT1 family protein [Mycobacterium hubeiense]|uniref:TMEM165/GDT1 family protein n=1 Tax=Mycobacterium hubeiense TaxID=1867256 RepID=UPI000C7F2B7F|nr:TMEM165/GDT1 family protein [Mycobacterium sp. QGD 101]